MKNKSSNIIVESIDGKNATVLISGKRYKLQHPGNRAYLRWQKENYNIAQGFDDEAMLDLFFQHCVFPENGTSLDLDSISPQELSVFQKLMHKFLSGSLDAIVHEKSGDGEKKTA